MISLFENHLKNNENEKLSSEKKKMIDDCIKDIEYLHEMIKLEDPFYAKDAKSFHIVPISGLFFLFFFILILFFLFFY